MGRGWQLLHEKPLVRVDASMHGCRTEFTQGGVNKFTDYEDDKLGERILKSGRSGFVGCMGFGGTCSLLTWWDLANTKARKLQKEAVRCAVAVEAEKVDTNNNTNIPSTATESAEREQP